MRKQHNRELFLDGALCRMYLQGTRMVSEHESFVVRL
jgi:hypothetical protein